MDLGQATGLALSLAVVLAMNPLRQVEKMIYNKMKAIRIALAFYRHLLHLIDLTWLYLMKGYVGHGMLGGAVAGPVFTSPPPASIIAAISALAKDNPGLKK